MYITLGITELKPDIK